MKAMRAVSALMLFSTGPAWADAPLWTVDAKNSRITLIASQMRVAVPARFERFNATIKFNAADLQGSKAVIDIDVTSVSTPNRDIETEIKREPWFDVARYPLARFETDTLAHRGGERYDATGKLTLRGISRTITLPTMIRVVDDPDRPGSLLARAAGDVRISRTAFGIGQGQWLDTAIVADEVVVHFEIVARQLEPGR